MSTIDETINGLRDLADWLEEKQDALEALNVYVGGVDLNLWPGDMSPTREGFRAMAALLPNPRDKLDLGSHLAVKHVFAPEVRAQVIAAKSDVCTRRQTGTHHVEAVPAHDEPVYGWDCEPLNILGDE